MRRFALAQMVVIVMWFVMADEGKHAIGVSLKAAGVNGQPALCSNGQPALCRDLWQHMVCELSMSDGSIVEFGVEYDFRASSRDVLKSYHKVDVLPWGLAVKVWANHDAEGVRIGQCHLKL